MIRKILILCCCAFVAAAAGVSGNETARAGQSKLAKFEPPEGKVLVFVGQDNEYLASRWSETMARDLYVHDVAGTYDLIRFNPEAP